MRQQTSQHPTLLESRSFAAHITQRRFELNMLMQLLRDHDFSHYPLFFVTKRCQTIEMLFCYSDGLPVFVFGLLNSF